MLTGMLALVSVITTPTAASALTGTSSEPAAPDPSSPWFTIGGALGAGFVLAVVATIRRLTKKEDEHGDAAKANARVEAAYSPGALNALAELGARIKALEDERTAERDRERQEFDKRLTTALAEQQAKFDQVLAGVREKYEQQIYELQAKLASHGSTGTP